MTIDIKSSGHTRRHARKNLIRKKQIFHECYLIHELQTYGYQDAILYRSSYDVRFLNKIRDMDLSLLKNTLDGELLSL